VQSLKASLISSEEPMAMMDNPVQVSNIVRVLRGHESIRISQRSHVIGLDTSTHTSDVHRSGIKARRGDGLSPSYPSPPLRSIHSKPHPLLCSCWSIHSSIYSFSITVLQAFISYASFAILVNSPLTCFSRLSTTSGDHSRQTCSQPCARSPPSRRPSHGNSPTLGPCGAKYS
jgi:hypothetical protein